MSKDVFCPKNITNVNYTDDFFSLKPDIVLVYAFEYTSFRCTIRNFIFHQRQQDHQPKMLLTSREIPVQSYTSKHYINTLNQRGGQNKGTRSTSIVVLVYLLFTLNTFHTTFNISQLLLRITLNKYLQKSGCCAKASFC